MTKVFYVYGDEYSALSLEQQVGIEQAYEQTVDNGGTLVFETDDFYAETQVINFGDIDPDFVTFLHNEFLDYDELKSRAFYIF